MYKYNAKIISVWDGDTVTAEIDLGLKIKVIEKIRLWGINAPEVRGSERSKGLKSRDFLRSLVLNKDVILQTIKDKKGKYGRYLGIIQLSVEDNYTCINDKMVEKGYAVYKKY